jgi:hypothetical protein
MPARFAARDAAEATRVRAFEQGAVSMPTPGDGAVWAQDSKRALRGEMMARRRGDAAPG